MRRTPRVSIVIPTYNYGRFLGDCVRSALGQEGVEVDVVIVNDGSTDDTAAIGAAFADRDPRVRLIDRSENLGHIATINEGFSAVDGEYLVKLDADDLLSPGSLRRATRLLEQHPEVGLVSGRPVHFSGQPPTDFKNKRESHRTWPGHDWIAARCRSGYNTFSSPEVVMRTSVMRDVGERSESLPHTYDLELWLQMAARADVARINGPAQGYYRVHAQSQQRTVHSGVLFDLRGRHDAFQSAFAGRAGELPDADELLATARRTLAGQALDAACRAYDRGRTADVPVDDLVAFALDIWPRAEELAPWRALKRRERVGAARASRRPQFVVRAAARRGNEALQHWRWERTGAL